MAAPARTRAKRRHAVHLHSGPAHRLDQAKTRDFRYRMSQGTIETFRPLDFRGDAPWTDSPAVAFAATSELWRRDSHTGSAFVTVSTAASIMGPFFTLPRCSLRMR